MRALLALTSVLLFGRVSGFYNCRQTAAVRCCGISGCTKVNEFHLPVFGNHDIIRRNVAVNDSNCMDMLKGRKNRREHSNGFAYRNLPITFKIGGQGLAIEVLHHDIGCIIFFKTIIDVHNALLVLKLHQALCFVQKFKHTIMELLSLVAAKNSYLCLTDGTGGKFTWKILFYCNTYFECGIPCNICYAKPAKADYFAYDISIE